MAYDNNVVVDISDNVINNQEQEETAFFNQQKRRHVHKIVIFSLWGAFFILIIRAAHFVIPNEWCWLSPERLQNIDKFLFSGILGGVIGRYTEYLFKK
jgi:hypothetical protein